MTSPPDKHERERRHRAWLHVHGDELREMGLPLHVFETWDRWNDFMENGHLHWHEDASHFDYKQLPQERRAALHRFLEHAQARGELPRFLVYSATEVERVYPLLEYLRVQAAPELWLKDGELPSSARDAILWLASRGAHPWLVRHHELVVEAAEALVDALRRGLRVEVDVDHVLLGAALHDAGKIEHPSEMSAPGHEHERAGERFLLEAGFPAHVARACVTHAAWSEPRAVLEDRLIALADKLWKGKRDTDLESALLEELATRTGRAGWEIFDVFDALCERIAEDGPDRLARSSP